MVHLLPPNGRPGGNQILPTDPMCKVAQQNQEQASGSPRLQASAGSLVALRYQENGHVTIPDAPPGKPKNSGVVYVYGTTQPSPSDTFLAIHNVWNTAGTGGDKRGKLIATQNFDDGQCYQVNDKPVSKQRQTEFQHTPDTIMAADLWCQNDIMIPSDAPAGKPYTLYWVWDWSTVPGGEPGLPNGKAEIYTTCMDIDITAGGTGTGTNKKVAVDKFLQDQSLNSAAVASYMTNLLSGSTILVPPATQESVGAVASSSAIGTVPSALSPVTSNIPSIATTAASGPSSPSGNPPTGVPVPTPTAPSAVSMVTVYPVTTMLTTVTVLPVATTPLPASASPSVLSPASSAVPALSSPIAASGNSSCAATQKRSKIFAAAAPQKRQPEPFAADVKPSHILSNPGSAKFRRT